MALKVKGTPDGIRKLLSGGGGAQVNGGSPPSRESRNKVKVDQSPSAVPKRRSRGARTTSRSTGAQLTEPSSFGQNYGM